MDPAKLMSSQLVGGRASRRPPARWLHIHKDVSRLLKGSSRNHFQGLPEGSTGHVHKLVKGHLGRTKFQRPRLWFAEAPACLRWFCASWWPLCLFKPGFRSRSLKYRGYLKALVMNSTETLNCTRTSSRDVNGLICLRSLSLLRNAEGEEGDTWVAYRG